MAKETPSGLNYSSSLLHASISVNTSIFVRRESFNHFHTEP
jgi:hypothetical protein